MGVGYNMTQNGSRLNISLPDWSDGEAVEAYMDTLKTLESHHGVKKLLRLSGHLVDARAKVTAKQAAVEATLRIVNGYRSPLQELRDRKRHLRSAAERFYVNMTDEDLLKALTDTGVIENIPNRYTAIAKLTEEYINKRLTANV